MSRSRRSFSTEFKDELCREVIDSSKPISEVARAYGVGDDSCSTVRCAPCTARHRTTVGIIS
ncbi:hypothetical protein CH298_27415 [Rhodococcoides fascians]|nr:transposase [Rhodococcus fascians]MBY6438390.1 transposase [Rhodococcus kroppenstedtii]OZC42581.1 hypothetical protein CH286_25950 [Rhodococcus sp. WWJCD1]OZC60562.1 hypothetical protein CH277_27970 [Rhodococcus sp. 06-469-3-2]OZC62712.1 hypothetical protein CH267_00520 [Rhodococcus sp. 06-621-2]OZC63456.1 hypothetical protein CH276_12270 [Rhodococcus sp. 06-470-2]OZC73760.1 hypothetical protein CH274_24695 [Rhodococcus sp. 06-418-5]OZC83431.1 hypothetical protein CH282_15875 [Rhodococcus